MRIYGNRKLKTLPGQNTRPTSARVREALFYIWQERIADCCWLDLCAGSGVMGAEALCRGAKKAVAIELNSQACRVIRQNWQGITNQDQIVRIIKGDVQVKLKTLRAQQFDLIYLDPPYVSDDLYTSVLEQIIQFGLLTPEGQMAIEHNPRYWKAQELGDLKINKQKTYGNTVVTFYSYV